MRKITQTIVGTTPPLDKNVIWLDNTDNTAPVEKVFINGVWTPMGVDTDDYYTKEEVNDKLDEKLNVIENPVNGNLVTMNAQGQVTNSGKKTTDFIATPIDSGSEGEVLSVVSEGNPVWTTVTPTGTADTEMSNTSTNAVQNKVIKGYVDNNFANKDGYYSTLTAGSAENLVGQTVDSEAYLIRPTGGAENEVANGVASVLGMEGNSCVWNQLVENGDFTSASTFGARICLLSLANNIATLTKNIKAVYFGQGLYPQYVLDKTHKYYASIETRLPLNTTETTAAFGFRASDGLPGDNVEFGSITSQSDNFTRICGVGSPKSDTDKITLYGAASSPIDSQIQCRNFYMVDLTLLGIDNLTTVAQVEAWLAQHVGTKPYYAYNAGEILSAQTLGIKTYGQNLLNPTTKQAKLIPYTWVENGTTYSNQYTIKNVPSGATATFTPDNTGVAETVDISSGTLDITSYGSGVLELSAATANTYVCIKWNGTKDDDVVPYEDHTYDFDVRKVYGKVSGAGEYVQCHPEGMDKLGTKYDYLSAPNTIDRLFKVNLGNLTWTYVLSNNRHIFYTNDLSSTIRKPTSDSQAATWVLMSKSYRFVPQNASWVNQDACVLYTASAISGTQRGTLMIVDNSYTDAASFKASLAGYFFVYELATPITYTDLIYRDNGVDRPLADVLMNIEVNNWSIEEQLMTPYEDGNPTSIPATIKTQYGMDAVEAIDTLQKTCYFADDVHANLQALLTCINTNCAETLGGTFAISETATDKVFAFSFTPNVEPTNEGE